MNKWNAKVDNVNKAQFKIRGSPPHVACRRRNGGFSLVEVLISMTIFAIAVLGLAIGAGSVMRANQTSYFSTIAVNLGQDKLEETSWRSLRRTRRVSRQVVLSQIPLTVWSSRAIGRQALSLRGLPKLTSLLAGPITPLTT
jgi:prepilin-type N-terminal cleavage/methylation domain-containing protein